MTLQEYQEWSKKTAHYPRSYVYSHEGEETFPFYLCLGLAGECGEVIEVIKKFARREDTTLNSDEREKLKLELGDVFWYWSNICMEAGFTLEEVLIANQQKINERQNRG